MEKRIMQRSQGFLIRNIVGGAAGVWLYIIFFSDKEAALLVGGVIGTILGILVALMKWCKAIIVEEDEIVLEKIISSIKIHKNDIKEIQIKPDYTMIVKNNGSKYRIAASGFDDGDMVFFNNYLGDLKL